VSETSRPISRRNLLGAGAALAGLGALTGCSVGGGGAASTDAPSLASEVDLVGRTNPFEQ